MVRTLFTLLILQFHPTGNTFVRAAIQSLSDAGLFGAYATTVGFASPARWQKLFPRSLGQELARRNYAVPNNRLLVHPGREVLRLGAIRFRQTRLTKGDGLLSIARVAENFSQFFARSLPTLSEKFGISGVYAYDHSALELFETARALGLSTVFELPIAYWSTGERLLTEERERWPMWDPTLDGLRVVDRGERKTQELMLADTVICPSQFVIDSIPVELREGRRCVLAPFGSPAIPEPDARLRKQRGARLRVLFAGMLSQRKGLADVFAAFRLLKRSDVELVVLGQALTGMEFYRREYPHFTYEAPRPHAQVLELMQTCDVFVFPSIVEGRALVQQEAMACGMPLIVTPNAGGEDLIIEGQTGFLVPIRRPDIIAERLAWCADHREEVRAMGQAARAHANGLTWSSYGREVVRAVSETLATVRPGHAKERPPATQTFS